MKKKYNKYYKLTKELLNLKKNYEYNKVDDIVPKAAGIILNGILSYFSISYFIGNFYTDHVFEKAKAAKGLLIKNKILCEIGEELNFYDNSQFTPLQIFNNLKRLMQNDIGESTYSLCVNWDSYEWCPRDPYNGGIDPTFTFKNGDIDNTLNLEDQIDSLLKDELSSWGILAASFVNLGWSIYNLIEVDKEFDKLKEYDKELENIRKDFYAHRQKLQDLPETLEETINYINEILLDIKSDQDRLKQHINKIKESIKNQESMQIKSMIGMGISVILGSFAIGKVISNGVGLSNMISIGSNITSGATHLNCYIKSKDLIIKLEERLNKAIKLNEEINAFIDKLVKELEDRKNKEIPKFYKFEECEKELKQKKNEKPITIKLDNAEIKIISQDFEIINNYL